MIFHFRNGRSLDVCHIEVTKGTSLKRRKRNIAEWEEKDAAEGEEMDTAEWEEKDTAEGEEMDTAEGGEKRT
ncbi:Hypothetical predicted protein [Octopus vulgaris]|uniref:Uncharacterized protein n=1 Tax=Octopus vulgaris TaxID=6645 RepID=A0AA36FJ27_OCTVU|nr:Hypothetical predicted protein [Octopus vulgaris]